MLRSTFALGFLVSKRLSTANEVQQPIPFSSSLGLNGHEYPTPTRRKGTQGEGDSPHLHDRFPFGSPIPATKLGPQLPRAVADENTLPNRQGAVIPYQQEVKDFVCHPGIEKQRPGGGGRHENQGRLSPPPQLDSKPG